MGTSWGGTIALHLVGRGLGGGGLRGAPWVGSESINLGTAGGLPLQLMHRLDSIPERFVARNWEDGGSHGA